MIRNIARVLCTGIILIMGSLTGMMFAIAIFIVTGVLTPGGPMYVGSSTPTLESVLQDGGIGFIVTAIFIYARHRLSPQNELRIADMASVPNRVDGN